MGLCAGETTKKKKPYKTIIIPKGVIDPNENNVIEIPVHLETNSSLIVKAPSDPKSCLSVEPYHSNIVVYDTQNNVGNNGGTPTPYRNIGIVTDPVGINMSRNIERPSVIGTTIAIVPTGRVDFSTQTHPSWANLQAPLMIPAQRSRHYLEAHSPLCPICARASCKYIRPYNNILNQITPRYNQNSNIHPSSRLTDPFPTSGLSSTNYNTYEPKIISSPMKSARSEIIIRSDRPIKRLDENVLLNKLLDDKIDKILKPLLFSLAKSLPDEEETEITSRNSYGSILGSKYSREYFYPRRSCSPHSAFDEYTRFKSSNDRMRRSSSPEPDNYTYDRIRMKYKPSYDYASILRRSSPPDSYEKFRRGMFARDAKDSAVYEKFPERGYKEPITIVRGNNMTCVRLTDSDEDSLRRKKSKNSGRESFLDENFKICSPSIGCSKRTNVNFEQRRSGELKKKVSITSSDRSVDLNKRIEPERSSTDLSKEIELQRSDVDLNKRIDRLYK